MARFEAGDYRGAVEDLKKSLELGGVNEKDVRAMIKQAEAKLEF
jgi:hypothetical protein